MIPTIEFNIYTNNSTLRGDASMLMPDDRDLRVLNKEYILRVANVEELGYPKGTYLLKGSVKCHSENDVLIVLNNLKTLISNNESKVFARSFLAVHYCGQVEDDKAIKSCTMNKIWSK